MGGAFLRILATMNEPKKHHFLPVFYLKRWSGADGRLVQFSRPYGPVVKPKTVYPKATGFIDRLYAVEGVPDELAQEFESAFLSPVDSRAAAALGLMVDEQTAPAMSEKDRYAWGAFINSLLARMPDDIKLLKESVKTRWLQEIRGLAAAYAQNKPANSPETFEELLAKDPAFFEKAALRIGRRLLNSERFFKAIAALEHLR